MIGDFARSLAGHDKNKLYVIISEDDEYVYLADGKIRLIEHPKKKKKKHIQIIHRYNSRNPIIEPNDLQIKRAIKLYEED